MHLSTARGTELRRHCTCRAKGTCRARRISIPRRAVGRQRAALWAVGAIPAKNGLAGRARAIGAGLSTQALKQQISQRVAFESVRDRCRRELDAAADDPDLAFVFDFLIFELQLKLMSK